VTGRTESQRLPVGVWLWAGGAVALLLALSARYGFHRDELYFIVAGRNLDWGYVDQPPFTPLVARASETVLGASPSALRILPALAVGLVAVLAGLIARRLGGGKVAQTFAAFTTGFTGVLLGVGHLLSTAVFDYVLWVAALWMLVAILDGANPKWWLGVGAVVGLGLQNKYTIGFFAGAMLIGILLTAQRRLLTSMWPWLGVVVAALIALPNLVWQANNGWPQLEMAEALRERSEGAIAFLVNQPFLLSVALVIPAASGFWWLARSTETRRWRPIPIAYLLLVGLFLITGGKAYYVAPMYAAFLAAGAVWLERLARTGQRWMAGGAAVGIVIGLFIALPLLPIDNAGALDVTGELGETVGWPDLIDNVSVAYQSIPADVRGDAVVFTSSYGEAGAIDVLGPAEGLPPAASGHNNYALWGPPQRHGPIIGVGDVDSALDPICPELDQVGTLGNPYGVENEALGRPLWLCIEPEGQLADIWESVRHYN
jgi:hypothetical protein